MLDSFNAFACEFVHTVILDIFFCFETELFLNLDLNPKSLRVKTVLTAAVIPLHTLVSDKNILKASAPGVVNTHRVVGGYRTVKETETFVIFILLT